MPCTPGEYHPYAACLMFKACHDSETVRANLEAVRGTPPAVAGEPWGACVGGRVFVGGLPEHARKLAEAENLPIQWLYTTQAQAGAPCRRNPFYHGPRNCSRGTVGCCEDHGAKPQAQAGAVPLTEHQIVHDGLMMTPNSVFKDGAALFEAGVRFAERHHGIKGGQHGADT
ncbi:hypothetical protein CBY09_07995 [Acidovorax kalamii]|uniref:Uncharacterized protein n=2 Tax=Acidovorax kalamii TaxID=2004485 RepID=A0A235EQ29_9BURK|nr:hypothetical protein CBY09_07995 [Acidovorax kalamii]